MSSNLHQTFTSAPTQPLQEWWQGWTSAPTGCEGTCFISTATTPATPSHPHHHLLSCCYQAIKQLTTSYHLTYHKHYTLKRSSPLLATLLNMIDFPWRYFNVSCGHQHCLALSIYWPDLSLRLYCPSTRRGVSSVGALATLELKKLVEIFCCLYGFPVCPPNLAAAITPTSARCCYVESPLFVSHVFPAYCSRSTMPSTAVECPK